MSAPLRCDRCQEQLAAMAATYGVDRTELWCETCAGPAAAALVYHYTVKVRPLSSVSRGTVTG